MFAPFSLEFYLNCTVSNEKSRTFQHRLHFSRTFKDIQGVCEPCVQLCNTKLSLLLKPPQINNKSLLHYTMYMYMLQVKFDLRLNFFNLD